MGHEEERLAGAALDRLELLLNLAAQFRIERAQGFVQEQQCRVGGERTRESNPLALPAGELSGVAGAEFVQLEKSHQLAQPPFDVTPPHALELEPERHVLQHRHVRKEGIILENHVYIAPVGRQARNVLALQDHPSGIGELEPAQDSQRCGLPAAGRSEQGDEFSRSNLEVHPLERDSVAESLGNSLETDNQALIRHCSFDLFIRRVMRSAQIPMAAVRTRATVAIALISGDMPERSSAKISTGSVG